MSGMYKVGEATWIRFWTERVTRPILAEVRVDLKNVNNIDIDNDMFDASLILYVRVSAADLYSKENERVEDPGQTYVMWNGKKIEEYSPWLDFDGGEKKSTAWVKPKENGKIVYVTQFEGSFEMVDKSTGGQYPFDYHQLGVKFSSNWDSDKLLFVPWGSDWNEEMAVAALVRPISMVDAKVCRLRNAVKANALQHQWSFVPIPRMELSKADGFSGKGGTSHVVVSLYVSRRFVFNFVYEMVRPLALALLAPVSLFYLTGEDELGSRISYNVSLLVAMTFGFINSKVRRVTFADYIRLSYFVFASMCLLLAINQNVNSILLGVGAWGFFAITNTILILVLLRSMPKRLRVWRQHRDIKSNSLAATGRGLTMQVLSMVKGGDSARERIRDKIRNQVFGEDD